MASCAEFDVAVVGGGLVGSAVAYGLGKKLAGKSSSVAVFDEGDRAFRASRGNFGLVWVQSKGWDYPAYAQWTGEAANLWAEFAEELLAETGVDVEYQRPGGFEFCLAEGDWDEFDREGAKTRQHAGGGFCYEMMAHSALKKIIPEVSSHVLGARYSPQDGHVNPLYLLRALHQGMDQFGISYLPNAGVDTIAYQNGGFVIQAAGREYRVGKVVLCAGLGNERLGKMVGVHIPVKANRGQLLITEKVPQFLKYPTLHVRQTGEGGLQIGDSSEDVGLDDRTSDSVVQMLAGRAVRIFPMLAGVRILRAWAALRVMTPDGKPIYQESMECPGAFGVACHSGVTLAAMHSDVIADWVVGYGEHDLVRAFSSERFDVECGAV